MCLFSYIYPQEKYKPRIYSEVGGYKTRLIKREAEVLWWQNEASWQDRATLCCLFFCEVSLSTSARACVYLSVCVCVLLTRRVPSICDQLSSLRVWLVTSRLASGRKRRCVCCSMSIPYVHADRRRTAELSGKNAHQCHRMRKTLPRKSLQSRR